MRTSESIAKIAKALSSFQQAVKQPEKDGNNPHFKSKYVTLDGTVKAIHDTAPKHGLSYVQMPVTTELGVGVVTLIMHESGEFIEMEPFVLPMEKKTAQGAGSATTYARRYSLSAAFGIVSDLDDDGNEATGHQPTKITPQELGSLKTKILEFAQLRQKSEAEVIEVLNIPSLEVLTSQDAKTIAAKLNGWIASAKKELKKQGA